MHIILLIVMAIVCLVNAPAVASQQQTKTENLDRRPHNPLDNYNESERKRLEEERKRREEEKRRKEEEGRKKKHSLVRQRPPPPPPFPSPVEVRKPPHKPPLDPNFPYSDYMVRRLPTTPDPNPDKGHPRGSVHVPFVPPPNPKPTHA